MFKGIPGQQYIGQHIKTNHTFKRKPKGFLRADEVEKLIENKWLLEYLCKCLDIFLIASQP